MRGPVRPAGQWWAQWQALTEAENERLIEDLQEQVRGHIPADTEIHRQFLVCYPRHALLRLTLSPDHGGRVGYAFYAPGQLYPLDWSPDSVARFNEVALDIRGVEQASAFLRFATWANAMDGERYFFVESATELNVHEPLSAELEAELDERLIPFVHVESEPSDAGGTYRFRTSTLHGGRIEALDWVVGSNGAIDRFPQAGIPDVVVPVVADRVENDRYFVLMRETSLTAERFLQRLRAGPVHQARVTEPVVLRDHVFSEPASLSQVTFDQGLDLEGSRFEKGLSLERCIFEGQLNLRETFVQGSLSAPGLRFHREGRHRDDDALSKLTRYGKYRVDFDGSGLHVEGSVYLEGLRSPNVVDLSRVHIEGDLRLGGCHIGAQREPTLVPRQDFALRLDAAEIEGDLDLAFVRASRYAVSPHPEDKNLDHKLPGYSNPRSIVGGNMFARRMRVRGEVSIEALRCEGNLSFEQLVAEGGVIAGTSDPRRRTVVLGDFRMNGAQIDGTIDIDGLWVGGDLALYMSTVDGSVFGRTTVNRGRVPPVFVGGAFDLSGIRVDDVDLEGAEIGSLRVVTGEIDRLTVHAGLRSEPLPEGTEGNHPWITDQAHRAPGQVGGVELGDLTIHKRLTVQTIVGGAVRLSNLDCGGDIQFWSDGEPEDPAEFEQWAEGQPGPPQDVHTTIAGDLECMGVRVGGRVVLTNAEVDGRIVFKNCVIEQDLNCQSVGSDPAQASGRTRTRCRHLDLELSRCAGDVDLAGLEVIGENGSVHARQLEVAGRILLARPLTDQIGQGPVNSTEPEQRVQAQVAGDLDLSVATTAQLIIAGSSVKGVVNLERGRFRRLDVVEPWLFDGHNLSDIQVDRWEIAEEHLRTFLDKSEPFARDTYVEIERMLRNKAQDAEADRVYRAMRARAIREAKRERKDRLAAGSGLKRESILTRLGANVSYLLRTVGSRLQGASYGWGTLYWAPLLVLSLVLVPISWSLMANPNNIVPTSELVASTPSATRSSSPSAFGVDWGGSDGFWMMLRYHVPVVPLATREDFRPAADRALLVLPRRRVLVMRFSTESWALSVYLLHWILWPLFLVGLARRIVRETT